MWRKIISICRGRRQRKVKGGRGDRGRGGIEEEGGGGEGGKDENERDHGLLLINMLIH
jgi:hypothetical protein